MTSRQLESRTRFAVLFVVALVTVMLGNRAYQASNLCLADMSFRHPDHYKLAALKAVREYEIKIFPAFPPAATEDALIAYLKANPDCCLIGKHGYSEYYPPANLDRIIGGAAKTVSLSSGVIPRAPPQMIGYSYVQMDNCGALYRPER